MRSATQHGHRPPAKRLGNDGSHILQGSQVVKCRQPVNTDDPVKLCPGFWDEAVAELDARKQEAGE
jgi:hypothetical protein